MHPVPVASGPVRSSVDGSSGDTALPVPRKALLLDSGRGSRLLSDMTITAVPPGPLAFLIAWPSGGLQPNVSSINSFASRILANSVIIPAGADGSIDVFAFNATDSLVDINGYYAPDDGATGLFYFPAQQCRAADTTNAAYSGAFGGPAFAANTARTIPVAASPFCSGIPANA